MKVYTIGFTQKSAGQFFETLKKARIKQLIDVRLNNSSQLAAFSKKEDLKYFLSEICQADYLHLPLLAPTQDMLDRYKKEKQKWSDYSASFLRLMEDRQVENKIDRKIFETPSVLLCSEATADQCHRSLVLLYLKDHWPDIEPVHL